MRRIDPVAEQFRAQHPCQHRRHRGHPQRSWQRIDDALLADLDQPEFDQTIAPGEPAFQAKEDAFFVNLREFPLLSVLYHPRLDASGAARDATTSSEGGVPHLHLTVDEDIEFATKPYFPVSIPVAMTFVELQGSWYLSDEGEPAAMTTYAYARPWFGGHISAVAGNGVTAIVDGTNATGAMDLGLRIEAVIADERQALGLSGSAPPILVDATSNGRVPNSSSGALLLSNGAAPWLKEHTYILKLDPSRLASLLPDSPALRAAVKDLLDARAQGQVGVSASPGPGD